MKKNLEHISKYYLIFSIIGFLLLYSNLSANDILADSLKLSDSVSTINNNSLVLKYPGKPLLMSLILPGSGQYYIGEPKWKIASFAGVELASILTWTISKNRAHTLKKEFQKFADKNWTLSNWVTNRYSMANSENNGKKWTQFPALMNLVGTHDLILVLTGSLKNEYGAFISSDSLEIHPDWVENSEVSIARDRHFYENIGKYDQFLGGWSDAKESWYWEEKDVGDTTEIVIKTPNKSFYINQRRDSNNWLSYAKFSISALMFNHVISGMDAVWSNQRKTSAKIKPNDKIETDLSLIFNPDNKSGIGGVSVRIFF